MPKHPSDGTLRRLVDEPVAVTVADEEHAFQCVHCQARMGLMRQDDAAVRLALAGHVEITPAAVARERLRATEEAGPALAPARARSWRGREAGPSRPRPRRARLRPATVVTSAMVLMGGATAAAATNLVPIFSPQSVAPVVVQAGDMASLRALSRFGTVTGTSTLDLTPESSAAALASAAGFSLPTVTAPSGPVSGAPSYWLVGPEQAQLKISVAKAEQAAAKDGASVSPAPAGVDGSVLQVATGTGALEVWGLSLPGTGTSEGLFGHSSSGAKPGTNPGSAEPAPAASRPVPSELPQLAVAEVQGPTVSSSGADVATLESYLLSQPGISARLAAQIRAIGDPSSTLPIPVPAGADSSTIALDGRAAVSLTEAGAGSVVVWAQDGRLLAVLGQASLAELLAVARQIA